MPTDPRLPRLDRGRGSPVDLVERDEEGRADLLQGGRQALAIRPVGWLGGIDHEEHDVGLVQRLERSREHRLLQEVAGFEQARSVEEDELVGADGEDPGDALPRRLGLRGDDRQVLPDQVVQKGGFARVGPPDERDVARAGRGGRVVGVLQGVRGVGHVTSS